MRRETRSDGGFTLIEMLVVLGIIGILSGIALPSIASQKSKARAVAVRATLRSAAQAQESLAGDGLSYAPAGVAGLAVLAAQGYNDTDGVALTVVSGSAQTYCLRASADGVDTMYLTNTGAEAGRITRTACA